MTRTPMKQQFHFFESITYAVLVIMLLSAFAEGKLTPSKLCTGAITIAIAIANSLEARPGVSCYAGKFRAAAFTLIFVWFAIGMHGACTP